MHLFLILENITFFAVLKLACNNGMNDFTQVSVFNFHELR